MDVREKLVELLTDDLPRCGNLPSWDNPLQLSCDEQVQRIADHLIMNGVTVQEWISVTEMLPDWRDGKVLVFTKYGFSICERTVNNRWRGQHANRITHWAYLPKPPKGE